MKVLELFITKHICNNSHKQIVYFTLLIFIKGFRLVLFKKQCKNFLGTQKSTNNVVAIKYNPRSAREKYLKNQIHREIKAHQEVLKAVKNTVHTKSMFFFA